MTANDTPGALTGWLEELSQLVDDAAEQGLEIRLSCYVVDPDRMADCSWSCPTLADVRRIIDGIDRIRGDADYPPPATSGACAECNGSTTVTVTTGKWNYSAPCPGCQPTEFEAFEVDPDHRIIGAYPMYPGGASL